MGNEDLLERLLQIKTNVESALDLIEDAQSYVHTAYAQLRCLRIDLGSQDDVATSVLTTTE